MKKTILTLLFTIVSTVFSFSQNYNPYSFHDDYPSFGLDVNGLYPFEIYTDTQMRVALGEPTKFHSSVGDSGGDGRWYYYRYGTGDYDCDNFTYEADYGGFVGFRISTPRFTIFGGRLKVGDPISKLTQLGFTTLIKDEGSSFYRLRWGDDCISFGVDSSNNITSIVYQPRYT